MAFPTAAERNMRKKYVYTANEVEQIMQGLE